jgi:hypothetical protein
MKPSLASVDIQSGLTAADRRIYAAPPSRTAASRQTHGCKVVARRQLDYVEHVLTVALDVPVR